VLTWRARAQARSGTPSMTGVPRAASIRPTGLPRVSVPQREVSVSCPCWLSFQDAVCPVPPSVNRRSKPTCRSSTPEERSGIAASTR
jgi:hypothetical protein